MELNVGLIKSVLNLYDEMQSSGIDLVYFGEFSHQITKMFASMADNRMEQNEEESSIKRRVYHVLVETLQNLNKHSDWLSDKRNIGSGLFIIGKKNESYYIITSNKVSNEKKIILEEQMVSITNATEEELKEMYKRQLKDGRISEKGGAGLGLIDIARKANGNLRHEFLNLDEDGYLFILKAEIEGNKV
ncbi:MAG: SiaB family protein kinase [Bacteroidales bacterium]